MKAKSIAECRRVRLGDCLVEITQGIGDAWEKYPVLGATRAGLAPAKESVGKKPERYKPIEPGTVFYNPMRILLGSIAMVDEGEPAGITSPDYVAVRPQPGVLHHRFFYYWLRSSWGEQLIQSLARGAVRERILFRRLAEGLIDLPPWTIQVAIAKSLAAVPDARRAAEERVLAATLLPRAILREAFERQRADGSQQRPLGELLVRHNEVIHPGDRTSGKAEFVGLEHIEAHTGHRLGSQSIDLGQLSGRKPTFRTGQIVYGYLRPYLNKVWIAEFDGCSSVDQFAFDVRSDLADTRYIAAFMRSDTFLQRSAIVTTTGQLPRISIDEIASVPIELPANLTEQSRIADELYRRLAIADSIIANCKDELDTIDKIPPALLRTAFEQGN